VVLDDRLYLGHGGLAGEVGHTILDRGGPPCACGRRGCAEAFVSQRAVSRAVTGRDEPVLSIDDLARRVAAREPAAVRGATQAGEFLGILLQNVANSFDPAVVVLGGPLCQLGDVFVKRALRAMAAHGGRHDGRRPAVQLCRFGLHACAVGAAASVFQDFLTALPSDGAATRSPVRRRSA
jgi:predicted NBD/HSP70 family sugar kinase